MRKLVTIQEVKDIIPIEGADFVELVQIMGWQCVVKKGDFRVGDRGVYFEVDSFLPIEEKYEFLRSNSYKTNEIMGEGFRIKTQMFRGELSQGLFLPFSTFDNDLKLEEKVIGEEVTELLGVKKWDMPEVEDSSGTIIGDKPYGIPTTDEIRVQSAEELIELLTGKPYYITTKMDGTSCTMYYKEDKVGVTGKNSELKDDGKARMWDYAYKEGIVDKLKAYGKNIALQGEYCGYGIQGNRLKLREPKLFIFDVYDIDKGKRLGYKEFMGVVSDLDIETVPFEEVGDSFNYNLQELLEKAKGKYTSGMLKEGIVVRSQDRTISFKIINNDFLLKEK